MKKKLIHRIDTPGIIFRGALVTSPFWVLILGSLGYWAYKAKITWDDVSKWVGNFFSIIFKGALFILPVAIVIGIIVLIVYILTHLSQIIMWVRWNGETKYHFAIKASKDDEFKREIIEQTARALREKISDPNFNKRTLTEQTNIKTFFNIEENDIDKQIKYSIDVLKINVKKD